VVALGVCALAAGVAVLSRGGSAESATPRDVVQRYDAAINAPVLHWGKIATLGMRAALGDLQSGQGVPLAMIAGEARSWQSGLQQVQQQMDAAVAPPGLRTAAGKFDQALQGYVHAAQLFEQAAAGRGDVQSLVRVGISTLSDADCVFDDAAVLVQQALRAAGLAVDPALPESPCAHP
jgi:hypothetical protein